MGADQQRANPAHHGRGGGSHQDAAQNHQAQRGLAQQKAQRLTQAGGALRRLGAGLFGGAARRFLHRKPQQRCQQQARYGGDKKAGAPAIVGRNQASAHKAQQHAQGHAGIKNSHCASAFFAARQVRDDGHGARLAARIHGANAYARGDQSHKAARAAGQQYKAAPQRQQRRQQIAPVHAVGQPAQGNAGKGKCCGIAQTRDHAQLGVAQAKFLFDGLDDDDHHGPIEELHGGDQREYDQGPITLQHSYSSSGGV